MEISRLSIVAICIAVLLGVPAAQAADYPDRPIRLVVPFAPGGGNDTLARLYGQRLGEALGQAVVVENRAGAGATLGAAHVARSAPDGYTLLLSSIASHAVSPTLYRNPGYDPVKDFAPVAMLGVAPVILAINPDVQAKTLSEFIAQAKSNPGRLNFGSGGVGSVMHTSGMVFRQIANVDMLHVPYKGAGPAYAALIAHEVDVVIDTAAALLPLVENGNVRALAIARKTRLSEAPEIPTFAEAGLKDFDANGWYSIHAPSGTPADIIARLNAEIVRISATPEMQERLRQLATETVPDNTPENLTRFVRSELAKYSKVIKDSGIQPD
jgi:tripartite-type tricarboxylate transporter receptor subunit TctC